MQKMLRSRNNAKANDDCSKRSYLKLCKFTKHSLLSVFLASILAFMFSVGGCARLLSGGNNGQNTGQVAGQETEMSAEERQLTVNSGKVSRFFDYLKDDNVALMTFLKQMPKGAALQRYPVAPMLHLGSDATSEEIAAEVKFVYEPLFEAAIVEKVSYLEIVAKPTAEQFAAIANLKNELVAASKASGTQWDFNYYFIWPLAYDIDIDTFAVQLNTAIEAYNTYPEQIVAIGLEEEYPFFESWSNGGDAMPLLDARSYASSYINAIVTDTSASSTTNEASTKDAEVKSNASAAADADTSASSTTDAASAADADTSASSMTGEASAEDAESVTEVAVSKFVRVGGIVFLRETFYEELAMIAVAIEESKNENEMRPLNFVQAGKSSNGLEFNSDNISYDVVGLSDLSGSASFGSTTDSNSSAGYNDLTTPSDSNSSLSFASTTNFSDSTNTASSTNSNNLDTPLSSYYNYESLSSYEAYLNRYYKSNLQTIDILERSHVLRLNGIENLMQEQDVWGLFAKLKKDDILVMVDMSTDGGSDIYAEQNPFFLLQTGGVPIAFSGGDGRSGNLSLDGFLLAAQNPNIGYKELKEFAYTSIKHTLHAQEEKDKLVSNLDAAFAEFEKSIAAWADEANWK
ncbi:MAG: hypothetical protein LBG97_10395 [Coriobacteriales bacterium]|jgi:hypothetical protein|nr:hypothetical protein [Coriobacteriales bacterium]